MPRGAARAFHGTVLGSGAHRAFCGLHSRLEGEQEAVGEDQGCGLPAAGRAAE